MAQQIIIDRFRLVREIGRGAAATVYEAWDERLGVRRALKRLNPSMFQHSRMRSRFLSEARAMARLNHPGVVRVFDVFIADQDACIVMEFVEGGSLGDRLCASGPLSPAEAAASLIGVLDALEDAHAHQIIHRDIKPHNLLLELDGRVRLTDFGIARLSDDAGMTRTGMTMGTWAFMAPEQRADAKNVDARADIYAAGATLFALLTGELTPKDLFAADLDPALLSGIPAALARIIRKATLYHREERYPSARAMAADLRAFLDTTAMAGSGAWSPTLTPTPTLSGLSPLEDTRSAPRPPRVGPPPAGFNPVLGVLAMLGLAAVTWLAFSPPEALRAAWPTPEAQDESLPSEE